MLFVYVDHVFVDVDHIVPGGALLVSSDIPTHEKLPYIYDV